MDYEQNKINSLLSEIEWLREDLLYLKDAVRSGKRDRVKGKADDFLRSFQARFENKM